MTMLDARLIGEAAACPNLRIDVVAQTGSTNQDLMERPFAGEPAAPTLLVARCQTAGRGRRGRAWLSPRGRSVAFSIAFERRVDSEPAQATIPIAVGVAAATALARWAPDIRLKWPNDLQRGGRKLAGILVECRRGVATTGSQRISLERVVVGIGLNLLAPPDSAVIGQPACGLFDGEPLPAHAAEHAIGVLAGAVVPAVTTCLQAGLAPFLDDWRRLDVLRGRAVAVLDVDRVLASGVAAGIDDSGRLRLDTPQGERVLSSGEVSLRMLDPVR